MSEALLAVDRPCESTPCGRCGKTCPPEAQRCDCGAWLTGRKGPAFKHGARSPIFAQELTAENRVALAEKRQAIEEDLGGADALSVLKRDQVTRYLELSLVADYLGDVIVKAGPLTPRGRTAARLTAFLAVTDRMQNIAKLLGLERRAKSVASPSDVLAQLATKNEGR